jgi:hypothetical protein
LEEQVFQLIIFRQRWSDLKLGYHASEAFPILTSLDSGKSLYIITLKEIETYDWDLQTITLTSNTTEAFIGALEAPENTPDEVKAITEMKKRAGWGNSSELALYTRCFVVKAHSELVYGGIFLDAISQMPINYPVARVSVSDHRVVISLLPVHIPFLVTDPISELGIVREPSITAEAQADVQLLNKHENLFTNWTRDIAKSDTANEFRKLIRDSKIKSILKTGAKIKN